MECLDIIKSVFELEKALIFNSNFSGEKLLIELSWKED